MLLECSGCKLQLAEEVTKCPQCGHELPAGKRKKALMTGIGFIVFAGIAPLLMHGARASLPENTGTLMTVMALIGIVMVLCSRFGNFGEKKP